MPLTDTHAHLDAFTEAGDLDQVLERAREVGVMRVVAVGAEEAANRQAVQSAADHPGFVVAAVGYDRDQAKRTPDLEGLESLLSEPGVVAVGEVGLDYHYSADSAEAQKALFAQMLELAARHRRPVIVHSREAEADTLELLTAHARGWQGDPGRLGVLHCFTGSGDFARALVDLGMLISFSGIITFRKADALGEVAAMIPDDHLLIETDAPLLAPVPYRGKRNEPAYLGIVAERLAEIRGCGMGQIADITTHNAERLFGLEPAGA